MEPNPTKPVKRLQKNHGVLSGESQITVEAKRLKAMLSQLKDLPEIEYKWQLEQFQREWREESEQERAAFLTQLLDEIDRLEKQGLRSRNNNEEGQTYGIYMDLYHACNFVREHMLKGMHS